MLAWPALAAPRVSITLPPSAAVSGAAVTLGDVARIESETLPLIERLVALPLGRAPRMGDTAVLTRAQLADWLKTRAQLDPAQIAWRGADTVVVSPAVQEAAPEALIAEARRALAAWITPRATRFELSPAEVRALRLPAGKLTLKARPIAPTDTARSRMQVWVEVWVDEQFIRVVPVAFMVEAHGMALVASADAQTGASIRAEPQEVPLARMPALPVPPQPQALRARTPVKAGQVIGEREAETAPAVSRGQRVKLKSVAGAVSVESTVDVLQDGAPGQMVRVRLPAAAGVVSARVVAPGLVEMMQ